MKNIKVGDMTLQELLDELWANRDKGEDWSIVTRRTSEGGYTATSEQCDTSDLSGLRRYMVGNGDTVESAVRALEEKLKNNCFI